MAREKEYTGKIILGAVTPSYDLETEPMDIKPTENISKETIIQATENFKGSIMQVPPAHSAIKLEGKRVYEMARRGEEVKLEPRAVTISEFSITEIEMPAVHFRVVCSTGTYIRSLANDFGKLLGCGGYLGGLTRTKIGEFLLKDSMTPEEFEKSLKN